MSDASIDNFDVNSAEYCYICERTGLRVPGLKLNLSLGHNVKVDVFITRQDLGLVHLNALTKRVVELICENITPKVLHDGDELCFYTDSLQVMNVAKRFIMALDFEGGEKFVVGDRMKI